jgi:predicted RNA-binding protein YlxR (DUF448 family)
MKKAKVLPAKHLPQRTCIACRRTDFKRALVRLVFVPAEGVAIDLTGKKAGRGAYLCRDKNCWKNALNSGKLERALRIGLNPENKEKLVNYAKGFDNTGD